MENPFKKIFTKALGEASEQTPVQEQEKLAKILRTLIPLWKRSLDRYERHMEHWQEPELTDVDRLRRPEPLEYGYARIKKREHDNIVDAFMGKIPTINLYQKQWTAVTKKIEFQQSQKVTSYRETPRKTSQDTVADIHDWFELWDQRKKF